MENKSVQPFSWKKLVRANAETLALPMQLNLKDSDHPLLCETLLRMVPRKRIVVSGLWGTQRVVAKIFFDRKSSVHAERDARGANILLEANVPAPKLLYEGYAQKKRIKVILFEKIEKSASLDLIWQDKDQYVEIDALMHSFIIELATQHVLGILQRDLHLKNFLVTDNRIYTLDGGAITKIDTPLDKKTSLENVGLFFAQLGVGTHALQKELFQTYVKARGWLVKKADTDLLQDTIKLSWQERWRRYQKKIIRNSTSFKQLHRSFKTIVYNRDYQSPAFIELLHHPDKLFSDPHTQVLKNGRSSTVIKVKVDNRFLVVKRYNVKNSLHWLRRCLRKTRAQHSWRLAQRLCLFGVATPKPAAFIEHHVFGLRGKSYFVMEYLSGPHCGEFFANDSADDLYFESMAQKILELFYHLGELQITHGDLKMTNILIHGNKPYLIDLDGMTEHTSMNRFKKYFQKELKRFMKNWKNIPKVNSVFEKVLKKFKEV